jgi:hypothetical protein
MPNPVPMPNPEWRYPGAYPPSPPSGLIVIFRGKEGGYFFIPLDGHRVLIASGERGFGRNGKEDKKEKHHRHGWD